MIARRAFLAGLPALVLGLAGCPDPAQRMALEQCQFSLRDVSIRGYGPLEIELLLTVGIHNPNEIDVIVDQLTYTAFVNDRRLGNGETTADVTVPRLRSADLPITLRLNLVDLGIATAAVLRGTDRILRVDATYWVALPWGRRPFPFSVTRKV